MKNREMAGGFYFFLFQTGPGGRLLSGRLFDSGSPAEDVALTREEIEKFRRDLERERKERQDRYHNTKNKLQAALDENQDKIQTLDRQIVSLKKRIEDLEKQLSLEKTESENIRNVIERSEKDYMKAEADYDRQKSYIAGKAEEEGKAVSSVASEEKEDEEKHWPRLQVEG